MLRADTFWGGRECVHEGLQVEFGASAHVSKFEVGRVYFNLELSVRKYGGDMVEWRFVLRLPLSDPIS